MTTDYRPRLIAAIANALGQPPDQPIHSTRQLKAVFPAQTAGRTLDLPGLRAMLAELGGGKIGKKSGPKLWPKAMRDRDYAIVEYLESTPGGATFRQAGEKFGVSPTTVGEARRRVMADRAVNKTEKLT
jgi:hypothetical protein